MRSDFFSFCLTLLVFSSWFADGFLEFRSICEISGLQVLVEEAPSVDASCLDLRNWGRGRVWAGGGTDRVEILGAGLLFSGRGDVGRGVVV